MNAQDREKKFEEDIRRNLEGAAGSLDGGTVSRLTQARHKALDSLAVPGKRRIWGWLYYPGVAAVAASLIIFVAMPFWRQEVAQITHPAVLSDMDIIVNEESVEFFEELEFYLWLAEDGEHVV